MQFHTHFPSGVPALSPGGDVESRSLRVCNLFLLKLSVINSQSVWICLPLMPVDWWDALRNRPKHRLRKVAVNLERTFCRTVCHHTGHEKAIFTDNLRSSPSGPPKLPEGYEGHRPFASEGVKGGGSPGSRLLRYRTFVCILHSLFLMVPALKWSYQRRAYVLVNRSMHPAIMFFPIEHGRRQRGRTIFHWMHVFHKIISRQVVLLWFNSVLVHVVFRAISGFLVSWLL